MRYYWGIVVTKRPSQGAPSPAIPKSLIILIFLNSSVLGGYAQAAGKVDFRRCKLPLEYIKHRD